MPSASYTVVNYLRAVSGAWRNDPRDDAELLTRFADGGDDVAFQVLVCRHGFLVWQTCKRVLGDGPEAEDAFQTTFLVLTRNAGRLRREPLAGWLYRVARRAALKANIRSRRQRELEKMRPGMQSKIEEVGQGELYRELEEELAGLPEKLRVPLLLHYLEGKSQVEVARILGCAQSTIHERLEKGEALLRKRLERRGVTLGAISIASLLGGAAGASAIPAKMIENTARAAVAFRTGALNGASAVAAEKLIRSLSLRGAVSSHWWMVLACVGAFMGVGGFGLVAWRMYSDNSNVVTPTPAATESIPPEPAAAVKTPHTDRYGDPLPPGSLARLGTMRMRHSEMSPSLFFTPDGKGLLTAGGDNLPRLWDVATGKLLREFTTVDFRHGGIVATPSPDGRILAIRGRSDDNSLYLLETATGKQWQEFKGKRMYRYPFDWSFTDFAFSPDSKAIVARFDDNHENHEGGNLELRDVATGRTRWKQAYPDDNIVGLAFSSDGKTLAAIIDYESICLLDARTGEQLRRVGPNRRIKSIAFSPDGRMLAVGYEQVQHARGEGDICRNVYLMDVATGKEVRQLGEPDKHIAFPVFSGDGKIVATRGEGGIRLWETATGKELRCCQQLCLHWPLENSGPAVFSQDGKILAAMDGPMVRFWDVDSGKVMPFQLPAGHESHLNSAVFTPDDKTLISAAGDHTIRWWDMRTGQEQRCLTCMKSFPLHMQYPKAVLSRDGKLLAVVCAEVPEGKGHVVEAFRNETRGSTRLLDATTGKELHHLDGGEGCTREVAFTPDGKLLAEVFSDKIWGSLKVQGRCRVRLWDTASGKRLEHELAGRFPCFSPDGRILVTLEFDLDFQKPAYINFWEVATGKKIQSICTDKLCTSEFSDGYIALSPDGKTLAIRGSGTIGLYPLSWDKPSGVEVGAARQVDCSFLKSFTFALSTLTFSPDGRMLAFCGCRGHIIHDRNNRLRPEYQDYSIHIWETASGKERTRFQGITDDKCGWQLPLSFTTDGRRLASGRPDSTILIWDVTGRLRDEGDLQPVRLSNKELESLWTDLESSDATLAGRALWKLVAAGPTTVSFVKTRLQPVVPCVTPEAMDRLLADLDAHDFAVREKAQKKLEQLGGECEPAVRQALTKQLSLDVQRSLQRILSQLEVVKNKPVGEVLRGVRAVEVLEQIGTPEARQVLEELTHDMTWSLRGTYQSRITEEADVALKRLK